MFRPFRSLLDDTTFIIVGIVIVGAFLIGGGHLLFQEKDYSGTGGETSTGTSSSIPTKTWSIEHTLKGCVAEGEEVEIVAKGPDKGYLALEQKNGGNYDVKSTDEFGASPSVWRPVIKKADGYDTKQWRLRLFQGGTLSAGQWSGGTEKASSGDLNPITCP